MTTSVASSRRKAEREALDLSVVENVNASINADRDVLRAAAHLKAARCGSQARASDAERAYHNAVDKAAVAKSNRSKSAPSFSQVGRLWLRCPSAWNQ